MALNAEARRQHADVLSKIQALLEEAGYSDSTPVSRAAGVFKGDHSHPFHAMGFVFSGQFVIKTGGKSPDPVTGISKPFFVPSMNLHSEQTGPEGAMVVIGRRWPDGELERISEGETRLLPTKSEEVQLKSDAKL